MANARDIADEIAGEFGTTLAKDEGVWCTAKPMAIADAERMVDALNSKRGISAVTLEAGPWARWVLVDLSERIEQDRVDDAADERRS